jgi:mono/diheme cytochrome c family protein
MQHGRSIIMMKIVAFVVAACLSAPALAQDKAFDLQAPDDLVATGFLKHLLPRFSLKTGIRITVVDGQGDAAFGAEGTPVFRQGETLWHFDAQAGPHTDAFLDWLRSDVGKNTIEGFKPEGTALFSADVSTRDQTEVVALTGDLALGEAQSLQKCGRCHVINDKNRMNAIGSTPSFALMRNFPDWQFRFESFFVLKPHASFTQVEDVTEPFPEHLPSPIAPIEVTLEEIEAITAYVGSLAPADLGAPIQSRGQ